MTKVQSIDFGLIQESTTGSYISKHLEERIVRMSQLKRVVMSFLLIGFVVTGAGIGMGSVAATTAEDPCTSPGDSADCTGSMDDYTGMLQNLFEIAHITLQYAGFITIFAGATLWFTARRSSDRAQTGVWLLIGGLAMIVFYFGFSAFVSLLAWIAEGSEAA